MDDAYIYYTVDGIEVIDSTTEAGSRYSAMNYLENRQKREKRVADESGRKLEQ